MSAGTVATALAEGYPRRDGSPTPAPRHPEAPLTFRMADETEAHPIPPTIARVLRQFRALGREEKMQSLLSYAKRLEPLPDRYAAIDRTNFVIPECQTRVDIFPEYRDGKLHFYADVNVRQSPTIAAFLSILFTAINDQPPATTLAIPSDFVRVMMENIGLGARETGLAAMVTRVKRYATDAERYAT
jgi:cysteine desulfuration protein SufE